jgi:hypothetical protein
MEIVDAPKVDAAIHDMRGQKVIIDSDLARLWRGNSRAQPGGKTQ